MVLASIVSHYPTLKLDGIRKGVDKYIPDTELEAQAAKVEAKA